MSTSAINNAYVIKGWLLGKQSPPIITRVVDDLIKELESNIAIKNQQAASVIFDIDEARKAFDIPKNKQEIIPQKKEEKQKKLRDENLPEISRRYIANERIDNIAAEYGVERWAVYDFLKKHGVPKREKIKYTRKPKIGFHGVKPIKEAAAVARADTPPEILIEKHSEYAGKRDPEQPLSDNDWHDIQEMLRKGASYMRIQHIAAQYNVSYGTMKDFIDKHLLVDAKKQDQRNPKINPQQKELNYGDEEI